MKRTLKFFAWLFVAAHIAAPAALILANSNPLTYNDFPVMLYFQHRASQFFESYFAFWGFDYFYSAGYPLNFTWNSNVFLQFLQTFLNPAPPAAVLAAATFVSVAIAPLCFRAGLSNFGLSGARRDWALIVMLAYWWTGYPVIMLLLGMTSGVFAFHICFYAVSVFYRFMREDGPAHAARLCLLVPLCFLAHKTAIVAFGIPAAVLFACHLRNVNLRRLGSIAMFLALTLAVNSFWLVPFMELVKFKVELAHAPHGLNFDPFRIFKDYFTLSKAMGHKILEPSQNPVFAAMNTILKDSLLALGIAGIIAGRKERARAAFFALTAVLFLALIYFGSFWKPAAAVNPTRYVGYIDFLLAAPAAAGAAAVFRARPALSRFALPALALLFLLSFAHFAMFNSMIRKPIDGDTRALAVWLSGNTTPNGRILLEDSGWNDRDALPPKYGEGHFPALLSEITGREFIGGPYPYIFLKHNLAGFHDGRFLGAALSSFSDSTLDAELNRYNIHWVVCWSGDCKERFAARPQAFARQTETGRFIVFERTGGAPSPFLSGEGFVAADIGGIRAYRVRPGADGAVVLKYHALVNPEVSGGGEAGAAAAGNDPVGFIKIQNPGEYMLIRNSPAKKRAR
ncbi:MAG TPA: hypothetical protein PKH33_14205 [bacterium]|nr:hypothetical protein [bacterium]